MTLRYRRRRNEKRNQVSVICVHVCQCQWELWKDFGHWLEFRCYCFWYCWRTACPVRRWSPVRSACATDAIRTVPMIGSSVNGFPIARHRHTVNASPTVRTFCHRYKRCRWSSPITTTTPILTSTSKISTPSLLKAKVSSTTNLFYFRRRWKLEKCGHFLKKCVGPFYVLGKFLLTLKCWAKRRFLEAFLAFGHLIL